MKLIGYARVSTKAQAEDGLGLEVQKESMRRWADAQGHRLVGIVRDEGVSGSLGANERGGLTQVLSLIATGKADGLLVLRLDRLARTLSVQEAVLAQVWKHGGRIYTVEAGEVLKDDPDDPMRTAMRQMMGVFGQLERGMIAARLRAGRRMKAEQGGFAYGSPPFGYRALDGELVPSESEQATLQRIRELRGEGLSLRRIAQALAQEQRPPKRGAYWHPESLRLILSRLQG